MTQNVMNRCYLVNFAAFFPRLRHILQYIPLPVNEICGMPFLVLAWLVRSEWAQ